MLPDFSFLAKSNMVIIILKIIIQFKIDYLGRKICDDAFKS
jgi:hypothetical protein